MSDNKEMQQQKAEQKPVPLSPGLATKMHRASRPKAAEDQIEKKLMEVKEHKPHFDDMTSYMCTLLKPVDGTTMTRKTCVPVQHTSPGKPRSPARASSPGRAGSSPAKPTSPAKHSSSALDSSPAGFSSPAGCCSPPGGPSTPPRRSSPPPGNFSPPGNSSPAGPSTTAVEQPSPDGAAATSAEEDSSTTGSFFGAGPCSPPGPSTSAGHSSPAGRFSPSGHCFYAGPSTSAGHFLQSRFCFVAGPTTSPSSSAGPSPSAGHSSPPSGPPSFAAGRYSAGKQDSTLKPSTSGCFFKTELNQPPTNPSIQIPVPPTELKEVSGSLMPSEQIAQKQLVPAMRTPLQQPPAELTEIGSDVEVLNTWECPQVHSTAAGVVVGNGLTMFIRNPDGSYDLYTDLQTTVPAVANRNVREITFSDGPLVILTRDDEGKLTYDPDDTVVLDIADSSLFVLNSEEASNT